MYICIYVCFKNNHHTQDQSSHHCASMSTGILLRRLHSSVYPLYILLRISCASPAVDLQLLRIPCRRPHSTTLTPLSCALAPPPRPHMYSFLCLCLCLCTHVFVCIHTHMRMCMSVVVWVIFLVLVL